jgi:Rps23 Pro-64 3,4-dihydroxylase Tpa1-like proline 4-hydroxylase
MPLTVGLTPAVRVAEPAAAPQAPVAVANTGFADGFAKAKAVRVENVLTTDQHLSLIDFATRNRQLFGTSGTTTAAVNYRESLVCGHFAPFDELLRRRVQLLLPKVCEQLGIAVPEGATEIQLTAHNHGHYYKIHNDNGSEALAHRAVSFVYYFHRQPKAFTGGALRLVDRQVVNGLLTPAETYKDIEPLDNSIVFFDSRELHEVRPVDCPSLNFADSRFTINGWVAKTQAISADTTGG